jgi:trehalose 6-phosphate phosphatase
MNLPYQGTLPDPADANDRWALFLDVDGTLIEFAATPDGVSVDPSVNEILLGLDRRFGHAVALVSGRSIDQLDHLFAPLRHTVAGLHGLERRGPDGQVTRADCDATGLDRVRTSFAQFTDTHPEAIVEDKGMAVALHFRRAPGLADKADALAQQLVADPIANCDDGLVLQHGKMVVEFRPRGPHKGDVVEAFMAVAPFKGRVPVFIGDDITDEDGFKAVNRMSGHSIRVGSNETSAATWRIDSVAELRDWLGGLAAP